MGCLKITYGNQTDLQDWQAGHEPESPFLSVWTKQEGEKELKDLYDFHARQYDPATGRFTSLDPANQFASGYLGMGNQPTIGIDPDGRFFLRNLVTSWFANKVNGGGNFLETAFISNFQPYTGFEYNRGISNGASRFDAFGAAALKTGIAGASVYTGGAVSGALGGTGFLAGAAGGATGGFISGAGNAWADGASFGGGLKVGGYGALIGGITGGVLGEINKARSFSVIESQPVNYLNAGQLPDAPRVNQSFTTSKVNVLRRSSVNLLNEVIVNSTSLNSQYALIMQGLEGLPYVFRANGPGSFDCSGAVCHGIRETGDPDFGDYTADQLFNNFTTPSTSQSKGNLIFYDYTSDGVIDHATTILNGSQMLHPSSGQGILQIKPLSWLDNYTNTRGGVKYYRAINWNLIVK